MSSPSIPSNSNLARELARVEAALEKTDVMSQRLPLLRRQAALGDLRDALAERKRRDALR
ncbi:MAG: hypothetical protein ACXVFN_17315 [Solirubrobacteraceae bacterium]